MTHHSRQNGLVILPLIVLLSVVAIGALWLNRQGAVAVDLVERQTNTLQAQYVAEAGLNHALWNISQADCSAYADASNVFGAHSYTTTVSPADGSPVAISAKGTLANGASAFRSLENVSVYSSTNTNTLLLQPGAPGKDTYVWGGSHENSNFGAEGYIKIENTGAGQHALLAFDLSQLPANAEVTSATLSLYLDGGNINNGIIDLHRVTRPWYEGVDEDEDPPTAPGATWRKFDGLNFWGWWAIPGGDYDNTVVSSVSIPSLIRGWYDWDVTDLVRNGPQSALGNNGVLLRASAGDVDKIEFVSGEGNPGFHPKLTIVYGCECGQPCSNPGAAANKLRLSTEEQAVISGSTFEDSDIFEFDPATDNADLYFTGSLFTDNEDIDAVHVLDNNHIVLSTSTDATLGGISFEDGDIVDYDPFADTATVIFSEKPTAGEDIDVDAVHVLDNGNILFSINGSATLGGLSAHPADIIEYNPGFAGFSLYFDHNTFDSVTDIDGFHLLDDGRLVISTADNATLGGLSVIDGDLLVYDPVSSNAILYFSEAAHFQEDEDVNAVHVDEPFPPMNVLMVVANSTTPDAVDDWRQDLIETWGHTVELIDDSAGQDEFNAATAANDVVYISGTVVASELNTKLEATNLGVAFEVIGLVDVFGIAGDSATKDKDELDVIDNGHYITTPFPLGIMKIYDSGPEPGYVVHSPWAPDMVSLAKMHNVGAGWSDALTTLEAGATTYTGGTTAGRRVTLPWTNIDFSSLNNNGQVLLKRSLEWASGAGTAPVGRGPVAHWRLDEQAGLAAADSAGGHHGELQNGPVWAPAQLEGGLRFDGSDDFVSVPHSDDLSVSSAFTISAWVRNESAFVSGSYRIISKETDGANDNFWLAFSSNAFWTGIGGSFYSAPNNIQPDTWYHVAVSFDDAADELVMYIDGVEAERFTTTTQITPNTAPIYIGKNWQSNKYWHGLLDDVRIYDLVLAADEITDLATTPPGDPGTGILMVVDDPLNLTTADSDRRTLIEEFGFAVNLIDDSNSVDAFDKATSEVELIYLGPSTTGSILSGKVEDREMPIVSEAGSMIGRLGFTQGSGIASSSRLHVVDPNHYVMLEFSASPVTFLASNSSVSIASSTQAPGLQVLGLADTLATDYPGVIALEKDAINTRGENSPARRVHISLGNNVTASNLLWAGETFTRRAIEWGLGYDAIGGGTGCAVIFADDFETGDFSGDTGTAAWSGPWMEVGESDGPGSGDILIEGSQTSSLAARIRDNDNGGEGIARTINATGFTDARLTVDYLRNALDSTDDYVSIEVSTNDGSSWNLIDTISGPDNDAIAQRASYNLSDYTGGTLTLRFLGSPLLGNRDNIYLDDIELCLR